MKKLLIISLILMCGRAGYSQVWMSRDASIHLFSETPLENIEATSKSAMSALSTQTNKIYFKVGISTFEFEKSLMQEHFNENYLESDKYPSAEFSGIVENMPDLTKEGIYEVTVKGKLTMHGVTMDRNIKATFTVSKGKISSFSKFTVKCADHKIEIPSLVSQNIAEEVEVTVSCIYIPKA